MKNIWKLLAVIVVVGGVAACNKDTEGPTDFSGGCEAVDLGITTKDGKPLKWATYNVGAQNVDERGFYYAWGETAQKTDYGWSNEGDYKWGIYDGSAGPLYGMTKYTADVEGGDDLKILQPGDDPATANWGAKWRTPTIEELEELCDEKKCEWVWDADKKGYTVKGLATGNSIFLPAAGYRSGSDLNKAGEQGDYWTSSIYESSPNFAYFFYFMSGNYVRKIGGGRCLGHSVRAVTEY